MTDKNVRKWVEALRSGKYKQGQHVMRSGRDKFCCLGVACDISEEASWHKNKETDGWYYGDWKNEETLSNHMVNFFGLNSEEGTLNGDSLSDELKLSIKEQTKGKVRVNASFSLAHLNDSGVDFDTIADIIEYRPEGLLQESPKYDTM